MSHQIKDLQRIKRYITAGDCYVILCSTRTKFHYSYKIKRWEKNPNCFFVTHHTVETMKVGMFKIEADSTPLAEMKYNITGFHFYLTKCQLPENHAAVRAFGYLMHCLNRNEYPALVEVWHNGSCGKCGRVLKDPESIEVGIGPECRKKAEHDYNKMIGI